MGATSSDLTLAAVIGAPIRHSLSPVMHNAAFVAADRPWHYFAAEVGDREVPSFMRAVRRLPFGGLSVTTPLKQAVTSHLDEFSADARILGAVNCVSIADDRLVGHNTDGEGCCDALEAFGVEIGDASVALLGAGATASAIALEAARRGARVTVFNRSSERARTLVDVVRRAGPRAEPSIGSSESVESHDVVVNATSIGLTDHSWEQFPVQLDSLHAGHVVLDVVYQPLITPFLERARSSGAVVIDGLWMLVHQAVRQQGLWFEESIDDHESLASAMRSAAEQELLARGR